MAIKVIPIPQHTAGSDGEKFPLPTVASGALFNLVGELHIQPATGNVNVIAVYEIATDTVVKELFPAAVNASTVPVGQVECFCLKTPDGNGIDPTKLGVKFAKSGDKFNAFVVVH